MGFREKSKVFSECVFVDFFAVANDYDLFVDFLLIDRVLYNVKICKMFINCR